LSALNGNPTEQDRLLTNSSHGRPLQMRGLVSLLAKIDVDESITERLASNDQGERRITNFRHIVEILSGFAAGSGGKPNEVIRWLSQEIQRAKGRADLDERQLRLESDEEAVKVVTMHASKGPESILSFARFSGMRASAKDFKSSTVLRISLLLRI
jgi:exodeoxyribonuclease V beta subunit